MKDQEADADQGFHFESFQMGQCNAQTRPAFCLPTLMSKTGSLSRTIQFQPHASPPRDSL